MLIAGDRESVEGFLGAWGAEPSGRDSDRGFLEVSLSSSSLISLAGGLDTLPDLVVVSYSCDEAVMSGVLCTS